MNPLDWLYAAGPLFRKGLNLIGRGFVLLGQALTGAVKWANEGLPRKENGEKDKLNQYYQKLVDQQQVMLTNQSLDLQRQKERTADLERRMDVKVALLEKKVEECQQDRDAHREQIKALNLLSGTNTGETIGGK